MFVGIFIDRHLAEVVPEEALVRMLRETEEQLVDSRGVRIVGHWLGDRYLYCLLDAPDADAACQHHTARGLACDEPREIEGVQGTWPVSAEDDEIVRTSIARLWPAATG